MGRIMTKTCGSRLRRGVCAVCVAIVSLGAASLSAQNVIALRPSKPSGQQQALELSDAEIQQLKSVYDGLDAGAAASMVATYASLGVDLLVLFESLEATAPARSEPEQRTKPAKKGAPLKAAIKRLDFSRSPQKVLAARSKLGFEAGPLPASTADGKELAEWLHQHVMAGDWEALSLFLTERAGDDAEAVYSHVVQSTNKGDPGLLPEEVLAIADASPGDLADWQVDALAGLLKKAAGKASTSPLIARVRAGTRLFGADNDAKRRRTVRFLSKAGLDVEAYQFLTPLEDAAAKGDGKMVLAHAAFHASRAASLGTRPGAEEARRFAWRLFGRVALDSRVEPEDRGRGLQQAVDMLSSVPRGAATQWLGEVFAVEALASAALEAVALKAMSINNKELDIEVRAQAILTMKEAVETLLESDRVELSSLRVPLRMLTLSLVSAAEDVVKAQTDQRVVSNEKSLVLRALPGARWRAQIEPSLALRAYRAFIGLAVVCDDMELGMELLAQGVERAGDQAAELADEFLRLWVVRLRPPAPNRRNNFLYFGSGLLRDTGLFTRGRQRRNLEVLGQLLELFASINVDARKFERVVEVFAACYDSTEAFKREDVERVLGPVDQLQPRVAAQLADAIRRGLSDEWSDVAKLREKGVDRTQMEIDEIVKSGFELAIDLVDSAIASEPDAWQHMMLRLSLVFDRMQYLRSNSKDPGAFSESRTELFRAFADAAAGYRKALVAGHTRPTVEIYYAWFCLSLGASDPTRLTGHNLETDAIENAAEIENIRKDMMALPADDAQFHFGELARVTAEASVGLQPEVKAGFMRRAVELVGDHPAASGLRREIALFEDIVNEEVTLRLTLDGSDRVGTTPFAACLSMRSTMHIARQLGGFDRYLRRMGFVGGANNRRQRVDFRSRMQRSIERAFDGKIELVSVGLFHSMNPPVRIEVGGDPNWEEKPFAYMLLRARDESADHLPSLQLDLTVPSDKGNVILPLQSNTVILDAVADNAADRRPVTNLTVHQIVDTRPLLLENTTGDVVKLEISATCDGVVPELDMLLDGVGSALPGFVVAEDGIETKPLTVVGVDDSSTGFGLGDDDQVYVEAQDGIFRLPTTRSWVVTYTPNGLSRGQAEAFTLPTVREGYEAEATAEYYLDFDLVPADGPTVAIVPPIKTPWLWIGLAGLLVLAGASFVARRVLARGESSGGGVALRAPTNSTPLAAIVTLQKIEREYAGRLSENEQVGLRREIAELEETYFARDGSSEVGPEVQARVATWVRAAGGS